MPNVKTQKKIASLSEVAFRLISTPARQSQVGPSFLELRKRLQISTQKDKEHQGSRLISTSDLTSVKCFSQKLNVILMLPFASNIYTRPQ